MAENLDLPLIGREKINQYNRQLILSLFKGQKSLARRDIVGGYVRPEKIVLSGQMSLAGDLFLETLSQVIRERTTPPINEVRIEWSQLADQSVPIGAIARALDDFYALPVRESNFGF